MAEFKKLSAVPVREDAADTAKVLVEDGDEIYRVPKTAVGGIKTAIIRDSKYLNTIADVSTLKQERPITYECTNMTFDEAYGIMKSGEPLAAVGMLATEGGTCIYGETTFAGTAMGVQAILIVFNFIRNNNKIGLYWTADGISTEAPSMPKQGG